MNELTRLLTWIRSLSVFERVEIVLGVSFATHLVVRSIRRGTLWLLAASESRPHAKLRPVVSLLDSGIVFVPTLLVEVYFGHAGKHLARTAGAAERTDRVHDVVIVGGAVACVVALFLISRVARRALARAVESGGTPA